MLSAALRNHSLGSGYTVTFKSWGKVAASNKIVGFTLLRCLLHRFRQCALNKFYSNKFTRIVKLSCECGRMQKPLNSRKKLVTSELFICCITTAFNELRQRCRRSFNVLRCMCLLDFGAANKTCRIVQDYQSSTLTEVSSGSSGLSPV